MSRFSYLVENVVANPDAITQFCERWAASVRAPEAKAWFAKRLRAFIMNNVSLLHSIDPQDLTTDMPAYVHKAAEQREKVYGFNGVSDAFEQRLAHIKDFFDNLWEVTRARVNPENGVEVQHHREAQKLLSKLQKMTFEQVEQAHEAWMAAASKQVANLSKEGCEVTLTFGDGFYWVRYTDLNTMKRDGKDLQNCLQTGNYWNHIQDGSQAVYGLRRPNDEAVVGVRVTTEKPPKLLECKGRNNNPPVPQYVPYIIQLLTKLGTHNVNGDLHAAGIHLNGDQYGTFEDIATVIYDKDRVKIMKVDEGSSQRLLVRAGRHQFWAVSNDGTVTNLTGIDAVPRANAIAGLNALDLPVSTGLLSILADAGIVPSKNGYGSIEDVGDLVWRDDETGDQAISAMKNGTGYLFLTIDGSHARFTVQNHEISRIPNGAGTHGFMVAATTAFNAAKVHLSEEKDAEFLWPEGMVRTKQGYVELSKVSKSVLELKDYEQQPFGPLLEVTAPLPSRGKLYFIRDDYEDSYSQIKVSMKNLTTFNTDHRRNRMVWAINGAIQWLAEQSPIHDVEGYNKVAGLYLDPNDYRYRSDPKHFIQLLNEPGQKAKWDYLTQMGSSGHIRELLKVGFSQTGRDENRSLLPAIQKAIYNALKPTKDELILVHDEERLGSWGGKEFKLIGVVAADVLVKLKDVLPLYEDQIESVGDAVDRALAILIRKHPRAAFKLMGSDYSDFASRLHLLISDANRRTNDEMGEAEKKVAANGNAEDHFAALNGMRKTGSR